MNRILLMLMFVVCVCDLFGREYFVGGQGASDNNPGTATQPFATIQKAATVAVAGDVVKIRSGTYRETIVPANSGTSANRIVYQPDDGATVTISGLNAIDNNGWTIHSGNIYKKSITLPVNGYNASITSNTTLLANQLFKDGVMMFEARWPKLNTVEDLMDQKKLRNVNSTSSFTNTAITDSGLPNVPGGLAGGKVIVEGWFMTHMRNINSQSGNTITFNSTNPNPHFSKNYFITGKLGLLTQAKEWHYESGTLYFWQEGGGVPTGVEYKARNWGFDLRNKSNTTIAGLRFIGCEPMTGNSGSANTILDNIRASYMNHAVLDQLPSWPGFGNARMTGTKLIGPNSVIKNSELKIASSMGVWLGANCRAENNLMHDIGYEGNWGAPFSLWDRDGGQVITRNTLYRTGRSSVDFGYLNNGRHLNVEVSYNDMSQAGMTNWDLGATYAWGQCDLTGLRIHHNWIHDIHRPEGLTVGGTYGIYFDQASGPGTIDHNVLWNCAASDIYHEVENEIRHSGSSLNIYNNTFATTDMSNGANSSYRTYSTSPYDIQRNNIYRRRIVISFTDPQPGNVANAILQNVNPQFVGGTQGGLAYRLAAGSPAINSGITIPGITDGSVGAPDIGAYEYGGEAWVPGYKPVPFGNTPANTPPVASITAPSNNATFAHGSAIAITATASDANGSVAKVEFFSGTTKLGEDTSSPYSFSWSGAAVGTHSLTVKVTDNQNSVATSTAVSITVNANTAPTVSITAPADNAQFQTGAPINITATATDANGSVTKVEFFSGTTKLGEDLAAPYSFVWNNAPAGNHSITARATDNQNGVANSGAIDIAVATIGKPVVAITGPANSAQFTIGTPISITATATAANGSVTKVEFFSGTTKLGEDLAAPYSFVWNNAPAGNHSITARATDNQNGVGDSGAIDIIVATIAKPVVAITGPANNAQFTIGMPVTITATATDANGSITKVEFFDGTTKIGEDLTSPYSFNWGNAAVGNHSLTAKATDNENNATTSTSVAISVSTNSPPVVLITTPLVNAQLDVGSAIPITVSASDANGNVAKVEFFNGSTKLGEDLTSPYGFIWSDAPEGDHSLTAKATDNLGATGTSAPITISVINPSSPIVDAGSDKTVTLPENSTTLTPAVVSAVPVEYSWTQVDGPNNVSMAGTDTEQLSLTDLIEGTYIFEVSVTDNNGKKSSDQIKVTVVAPTEATAFIPRFFSPNDDGNGDLWEWQNTEQYENSLLTIFNRAGQKIYEALSYKNTWDGKVDGQPLQAGDYYYIIRLADLTDIRGAVRIIR